MRDLISALSNPVSGFPSPFGGRRRWSPGALFSGGEAGALYLPGPDTCFQDAAGTTPAGDGDPVGYLADLSGNGNHATQATSARRPTLVQDGSGDWYLDFDGVDDDLITPLAAYNYTGDQEIITAARHDTGSGTFIYLTGSRDDAGYSFVTYDATARMRIYVNTGAPAEPIAASAIGTVPRVFGGRWDRSIGTATMRQDTVETSEIITPADVTAPAAQYMGSGALAGSEWAGRIYGMMTIDRILTATERAQAEDYLANLSGVTL